MRIVCVYSMTLNWQSSLNVNKLLWSSLDETVPVEGRLVGGLVVVLISLSMTINWKGIHKLRGHPLGGNERGHGNDDDGNDVMNEKFSTKAGSFCCWYIVSKDF